MVSLGGYVGFDLAFSSGGHAAARRVLPCVTATLTSAESNGRKGSYFKGDGCPWAFRQVSRLDEHVGCHSLVIAKAGSGAAPIRVEHCPMCYWACREPSWLSSMQLKTRSRPGEVRAGSQVERVTDCGRREDNARVSAQSGGQSGSRRRINPAMCTPKHAPVGVYFVDDDVLQVGEEIAPLLARFLQYHAQHFGVGSQNLRAKAGDFPRAWVPMPPNQRSGRLPGCLWLVAL